MEAIKQPYCFEVGAGDVFAFAGLWDEWKNPSGIVVTSCTILTTAANSLIAAIHDRMPVILPPEKYELWLTPEAKMLDAALAALQPYDANAMRRYPVSRRLNDSRNDDPECSQPIRIESSAQKQLF
jgi:putative SOS response-associated peptidase YedK